MDVFPAEEDLAIIRAHDPALQSTRVACLNTTNCVAVDGLNVHILSIPHQACRISRETVVEKYRSDMATVVNTLKLSPKMHGNLQSVVVNAISDEKAFCFSVDSRGSATAIDVRKLATEDLGDASGDLVKPGDGWNIFNSHTLSLPFCAYSSGWAGISCDATAHQVVTTHYMEKLIQTVDVDTQKLIRSTKIPQNPTAILHGKLDSSSLLISEKGSISSWDPRSEEKGGCTNRISVSRYPLWSLSDLSNEFEFAAAGADKTVYVYDTRTWRARIKWRSPCKFDIIKLMEARSVSSASNRVDDIIHQADTIQNSGGPFVYLAGWDNEVLLCDLSAGRVTVSNTEKNTTNRSRKRGLLEADQESQSAGTTVSAALPPGADCPARPSSGGGKLKQAHSRSVRAESRWIGVSSILHDWGTTRKNDVAPIDVSSAMDSHGDATEAFIPKTSDRIVGICALGKIYVFDQAERMIPVT